uniref:Acyl_transf_3 domain-containing protein n=1 Tax=Elaeophora elaphi TaxID=1147741 RepID=A0A0R3S5J5_9BILA
MVCNWLVKCVLIGLLTRDEAVIDSNLRWFVGYGLSKVGSITTVYWWEHCKTMPGIHTFYDGSTILQPLADVVGLEVDKVNLLLCQFISLPLAYLHYLIFTSTRISRTIRVLCPAILGLMFCYFCFGKYNGCSELYYSALKHLILLVGLSYAIMRFFPPKIVHKCIFIFAMGYLVFLHWYRWYVFTTYYLDVTGPMMILVQKITVLAFTLHDGRVKKTEELNDVQKREALT